MSWHVAWGTRLSPLLRIVLVLHLPPTLRSALRSLLGFTSVVSFAVQRRRQRASELSKIIGNAASKLSDSNIITTAEQIPQRYAPSSR